MASVATAADGRREYQTAGSNDAAASACRLRWLRSSSFHCAYWGAYIIFVGFFALRVLHPHWAGVTVHPGTRPLILDNSATEFIAGQPRFRCSG